jgi:chromate transporter
MQFGVILLGGIAGLLVCRTSAPSRAAPIPIPVSRRAGITSLTIFTLFLVGLPLLARIDSHSAVALFDAFYRSGALVFGGGHVVLPLLRDGFVTPGWISDGTFLAGYGAAQAVPGPLFAFAAYLGAVAGPTPLGLAGAVLGLVGVFLPGMLILVGTLPFWVSLRSCTGAQAAMRGINAAVVGLLCAALYNPLCTSSINTTADFSVALVGFVMLTVWRTPPVWVVILGALSGITLAQTWL